MIIARTFWPHKNFPFSLVLNFMIAQFCSRTSARVQIFIYIYLVCVCVDNAF